MSVQSILSAALRNLTAPVNRINTAPSGTPYTYGAPGIVGVGVGTGPRPFSTGQFNIPYAPYDRRHLVRGDLSPLKMGGVLAFATVRDVSLSGNGTTITGAIRSTALAELDNQAQSARGVLG